MVHKIELHDFPNNLAKGVKELWTTYVAGEYVHPPQPSDLQLRSLLEVAYLASMETDEGRPLKLLICCTPVSDVVHRRAADDTVQSWSFTKDRACNIQEIRRLAVSANVDTSAIWVRFPDDPKTPLEIHGLLNLGSSWTKARNAFTYHYDPLPEALLVRVDGPGQLAIYQGQYLIASIKSGKVQLGGSISTIDLLGIYPIINEGHDFIGESITSPKHEEVKEWHTFEWLAYVNTILAVVNTIQLSRHGGALVYASMKSRLIQDGYVKLKYPIFTGNYQLRKYFIAFMNLRHRFGDMVWLSETNHKSKPSEQKFRLTNYELKEAQDQLAEACSFVGNFAGTDGAIIIRNDLTVEGYGAEIVLDKVKPATVYEVNDPMRREKKEFDSEQFGMRHRSAMRLCATVPDLSVFVISQDGGVSLVWNDKGEVCFKSGIRTVNQNMIFA